MKTLIKVGLAVLGTGTTAVGIIGGYHLFKSESTKAPDNKQQPATGVSASPISANDVNTVTEQTGADSRVATVGNPPSSAQITASKPEGNSAPNGDRA